MTRDPRAWVRIDAVDRLAPFLISVVSPSDHWLYASSRGAVAAGRVDPDTSLFPYWTDDRLHRAHGEIGPWTLVRVRVGDRVHAWTPWRGGPSPHIDRSVAKSVAGDRLVLEEVHRELGLRFRARWGFSERWGLVRTVELEAHHVDQPVSVELVDGLQGILPAGAPLGLVQTASCLVNAYARSEWDAAGEVGLFTLEAAPSDRAEPAESLRATVAWCAGLDVEAVLLSPDQLGGVTAGEAPRHEPLALGRAGAFLVASRFALAPGETRRWHVVADVGRTHVDVAALRRRDRATLDAAIEAELDATTAALDGILADVDGLQRTADPTLDAHVRASALFNAMRGGVPLDEHRCDVPALRAFLAARNAAVAARAAAWLASLGDGPVEVEALIDAADATGDPDLSRLARELLPLWFGRRHGDPSRPWNRFSIRVRDAHGGRRLAWQGNWRDVFQNWEALLLAYPGFAESVVAVFVNASTLDGYNPYRISSDGLDWEVPEPENPWSNLGYWGDHQISYLTRLLELARAHHPGRLERLLTAPVFSSADVPYRLRPYAARVADPRDAVAFDEAAHHAAMARVAALGADGRLVPDGDGVLHIGLAEKLLIPVLAKLTSLVPGAGVWLDTQRPEWNDANNALAGPGVSVVTAAYLRRHVDALEDLFAALPDAVTLLGSTAAWLDGVLGVLAAPPPAAWTDAARREVMDALGAVGTAARDRIYAGAVGPREERAGAELVALCRRARAWLDDALARARRADGLVDGYDLVAFGPGAAAVARLEPMLEGQVAMLSAGVLSHETAADLLERLYESPLHRADLDTFLLYPARRLPSFLEKNRVPEEAAAIPLLRAMLAAGDARLVARDADGALRFAADLRNAADLAARLDALGAAPADRAAALDAWERTFHHAAFTGRSGTMYAYEGLGSVYWHMVGKLLLAAQECVDRARDGGARPELVARLEALERRVRAGLGYNHPPEVFGAFPTDPYSHSPAGRGAQQPGMTGLVKEELIARRRQLGVRVAEGRIAFDPRGLDPAELLPAPAAWEIPAGVRPARVVELPAGSVGFLLCGLPVVLEHAERAAIAVHHASGAQHVDGAALDRATSARIFARDPSLRRLHVRAPVGPR